MKPNPPPPAALPNRLMALDGWRAIACLLVLFHHTGFVLRWGPVAVWGFTGVHLFFVLSGYLLFRPLCKAMRSGTPFDFKNFYIRRALRIYPAYLLALAAYVAVRYVTRLHPPSARDVATHILFAFNSGDMREFFGINVAFWTLAVEAQFYVLLPVLSWFVFRLAGRRAIPAAFGAAALFVCLGICARGLELLQTTGSGMPAEPMIRFHTVFSFLDCFGCGMFVAALATCRVHAGRPLGVRVTAVTLISGTALFLLANGWCSRVGEGDWMLVNNFRYLWAFPPMVCGGLAAILFVVVASDGFLPAVLASRPLVYVGKVSYSVYLFHILVQLPMFKLLPLTGITNYTLRTFAWGMISLIPTLIVATVAYAVAEAPFLRLAERFKTQGRGRVSAPSALERALQPNPAATATRDQPSLP